VKNGVKTMLLIGVVTSLAVSCWASDTTKKHGRRYVVTNDDVFGPYGPNTATFYVVGGTASAPKLTLYKAIQTGGSGAGNGADGTNGIVLVQDAKAWCLYVSDAQSEDIAGIALGTQKVVGNFKGSRRDDGSQFGIGLAANSKRLYASYTGSRTIGTFKVLPGCKLRFLGDVSAVGLGGGEIAGMGLHANMLVTTYADGSIQSFHVRVASTSSSTALEVLILRMEATPL
jgi:hypothetical protein